MSTEFAYLLSSVGLYGVMILVQAVAATTSGAATPAQLLGPRDTLPAGGLSRFHGRSRRAQDNFTESLIMFAPLVLMTEYLGQTSAATAVGAALFFYGRLAFAPLYYFGVPYLRTLAWTVSIAGLFPFFAELIR